jgi:hypothetical protein
VPDVFPVTWYERFDPVYTVVGAEKEDELSSSRSYPVAPVDTVQLTV